MSKSGGYLLCLWPCFGGVFPSYILRDALRLRAELGPSLAGMGHMTRPLFGMGARAWAYCDRSHSGPIVEGTYFTVMTYKVRPLYWTGKQKGIEEFQSIHGEKVTNYY